MATWEDGPEYAPLQPPDQFSLPDAPPLSVASPPEALPDVPGDRPGFGDPDRPVAALAALDPDAGGDDRDPRQPFDVESQTMTEGGNTGGAWGAAHWRPPTGAPIQPTATAQAGWGPPPGPQAPPTGPVAVQSSAPGSVAGMPAPGTPEWFGPGPGGQQAQQRPTLWNASPAGALIMLLISLTWFAAPFTFAVAFILTGRAQYARQKLLIAFTIVGGAALTIATISTLTNYGGIGTWYSRMAGWCLAGSIVMIILILFLTARELDQVYGSNAGGGNPPGPPGPPVQPPPSDQSSYPGQSRYPDQTHRRPQ